MPSLLLRIKDPLLTRLDKHVDALLRAHDKAQPVEAKSSETKGKDRPSLTPDQRLRAHHLASTKGTKAANDYLSTLNPRAKRVKAKLPHLSPPSRTSVILGYIERGLKEDEARPSKPAAKPRKKPTIQPAPAKENAHGNND